MRFRLYGRELFQSLARKACKRSRRGNAKSAWQRRAHLQPLEDRSLLAIEVFFNQTSPGWDPLLVQTPPSEQYDWQDEASGISRSVYVANQATGRTPFDTKSDIDVEWTQGTAPAPLTVRIDTSARNDDPDDIFGLGNAQLGIDYLVQYTYVYQDPAHPGQTLSEWRWANILESDTDQATILEVKFSGWSYTLPGGAGFGQRLQIDFVPIFDFATEGPEHVDFTIVPTSDYQVKANYDWDRGIVKDQGTPGAVMTCSCECACAGDFKIEHREGDGALQYGQELVGGLDLVFASIFKPAPIYILPGLTPYPGSDGTINHVDVRLTVTSQSGTAWYPSTELDIPTAPEKSFVAAIVDSPSNYVDGQTYTWSARGEDVNGFVYSERIGATETGKNPALSFPNGSRGSFIYKEFLFPGLATGWWINGLSMAYFTQGGTGTGDDGNEIVWSTGPGRISRFRKLGNDYVPIDRSDDGSRISPLEPNGIKLKKPDGSLEELRVGANPDTYVSNKSTDRWGNETNYQYDANGRLEHIVDVGGRTTDLAYVNGKLSQIVYHDVVGTRTVTFGYDGSGRLTTITNPDPNGGASTAVTSFSYATSNHPFRFDSVTDAVGRRTILEYEGGDSGRLTKIRSDDDNTLATADAERTFTYIAGDSNTPAGLSASLAKGLMQIRTTDELGAISRTWVDRRFGLPVAHIDALGSFSSTARTGFGLPRTIRDIDPDGSGPTAAPVTRINYTPSGEPNRVEMPDGGKRVMSYDSKWHQLAYEKDEVGREVFYDIDVDTGHVRYQQEVVGTKDTLTNYNSTNVTVDGISDDRVVVFSYTTATMGVPPGLLLKERDSLNQLTTYEYWVNGVSGGNVANHGKVHFIYLPTVTGETAGSIKRQFAYDNQGNLSQYTDELGQTTDYAYDLWDRFTTITFPDPYPDLPGGRPTELYAYDKVNRPVSFTDKNVRATTYAYNYLSGTKQHEVVISEPPREAGGASVVSKAYYDALGNLVQTIDPLGRISNQSFDVLNRLVQIQQPDPDGAGPLASPLTAFAYDRMGRQAARIEPADLRNMNPLIWSNQRPSIEAGAQPTITATTRVQRSEVDLFTIFKDDQDSDSVLQYTILDATASGGGSSAGLFDRLYITSDNPRKLMVEYAGSTSFTGAKIKVRATDTSGLTQDHEFTVNRTQATTEEFWVNSTSANTQKRPVVAPRGGVDGGFIVVWEDAGATSIRARLFNDDASTFGSEFTVNTTTNVYEPSVAVAADGSFVVAYWQKHHTNQAKLIFQRFNSSGTAQGTEVVVYDSDPYSLDLTNPYRAAIAYLASGNFVITYHGPQTSDTRNVMARRYAADGAGIGSEFQVNTTSTSSQNNPSVAATLDGGFLIAWDGNGAGDSSGVFARKYTSSGTAVGSESLLNTTTTNTQAYAVTPAGGSIVAWEGNGSGGDTLGVYSRLRAADGTPASGEILINDANGATQNRPSIAAAADGGFVVVWQGNGGSTGYDIYARRVLANGVIPAGWAQQVVNVNTTALPSSQIEPVVAVTRTGAAIVVWSGNGPGDTSGIFGRFVPLDTPAAVSGSYRVMGVSGGDTVQGPVSSLVVDFSAPVDPASGLLTAGDFTIIDPNGATLSSSNDYSVKLISARQVLITITNTVSKAGTYTVTVKSTIPKVGGGLLDQNLDGTGQDDPRDYGQFAFYLIAGESAPSFVNAGTDPIPNITLGQGDDLTPSSSVDLAAQFKDAQQPATELMYSIVSITGDAQFRSARFSNADGSTLVLTYATGLSGTKTSNITVRATDVTGRYTDDTFSVTRPTPLGGSTIVPSSFRVLGVEPYQVGTGAVEPYQLATGALDRFVITFNGAIDPQTLLSGDVVVRDPSNALVPLNSDDPNDPSDSPDPPVSIIAKDQVLVRLENFITTQGAYRVEVGPNVSVVNGGAMDQDQDGVTGTGEETDDKYATTFYYAPGPRTRTKYDAASRPVATIDALGNVTQSVYDLAGQLRAIVDPLNRKSIVRYNDLGLIKSIAQPYPEGGTDRDYDNDETGGNGSWGVTGSWQPGPSGFESDSKQITAASGGTATATWTFNSLTAGKTYEVLATWPSSTSNTTNAPFTVFDNTTSLETVRVNQQVAPETHPTLGAGWQTLGYYTLAPDINIPTDSHTLKVELKNNADAGPGNNWQVVADAIRIVEVSAQRYAYDKVGNLEVVTDARGSRTKYVYDERYRQTEMWEADPLATGTGVESSSQKTLFQYDTVGQLKKVTDQLGRETGWDYDNLGRKRLFKQANPSTGLISSGWLPTDYRFDNIGNLISVQQPDLGGAFGRPLTEYAYDQHDNLKQILYPDPDGTDTVYTSRPAVNYQYDDADRRRTEIDPLSSIRWNSYDELDRLTKVEDLPSTDLPFDDPSTAVSGWNRLTTNSGGYGGDRYTSTTGSVLTINVSGLTLGKTYRVLATWMGDLPGDATVNSADTQYTYKEGSTAKLTTHVNQQAFPTNYFDGTRGWNQLGTFTADSFSGTMDIQRIAGTGEAQADAIRIVELGTVTDQYAYDARSNLLRTTDALGRITQTVYDTLDRQRSAIDALGSRDFVLYDAAGQLTQQVDQLGRATFNAYDPLGRVKSVTQADPDAAGTTLAAPQWLYGYDAVGNRVSMTDPRSNVTTYEFDRLNRLTKVLEPAVGGVQPDTRYEYYADGRVQKQRDAEAAWTEFVYDKLGRLEKRWDPNASTGLSNDGLNPLGPAGPQTVYGYDALSRKTSETLPDPDAGGSLLSPVTTWTYDNLGRVSKVQQPDPDGAASLGRPTTEYVYDVAGNLTTVKTPNPADVNGAGTAAITTSFAYDYLNRRTSVTRNDPDGASPLTAQVTAYGYDLVGNLTKVTEPDPDGSGALQSPVTWHYFDALNRETATLDPREGMTRYAFDAVGNRLSLTDPVLNATTWTYDRLNRPTADINTLGDARRYVYDPAGNQTRAIDRLGRVRQFVYDNLNRRTDEKWYATVALADAAGTPDRTFTWTYDLEDRTKTANDPAANLSYNYDKQGNVLLVTNNVTGLGSTKKVFLEQTYDNLGRRIDSKASIGTNKDDTKDYLNSYSFDALNRLKTITQDDRPTGTYNQVAEKNVSFVYNALGQTQKITRYSNVTGTTEVAHSDFAYDMFAHLTSISHKKPSGPSDILDQFAYTFDNLNRVTGVDFTTQVAGADYNAEDVTTYAYDATDQLTTTDRTTGADESFVHDLNGNRRMSGTTNWVVGANNQLMNDGTYTYQYDKEGNRTKRTKTSDSSYVDYVFDSRNRLTQAKSKNSGGTVTQQVDYVYDAYDRLVKRTFDQDGAGGTYSPVDEYFVYDGNDVALRFDGAGNLTKRYLNGQAADQVLSEEQISAGLASNDRVYWALADNLGTVRDVINQVAARKNHLTYDAFGKITTESDTAIDFLYGFTGLLRDEATGYYLTQTRWLDPGTGKWLQEDWIGFDGRDTNLMRYVGNSPTNLADPTGQMPPGWLWWLFGPQGEEAPETQPAPAPTNPLDDIIPISGEIGPEEQLPAALAIIGAEIRALKSAIDEHIADLEGELDYNLKWYACWESAKDRNVAIFEELQQLKRMSEELEKQHQVIKDTFDNLPNKTVGVWWKDNGYESSDNFYEIPYLASGPGGFLIPDTIPQDLVGLGGAWFVRGGGKLLAGVASRLAANLGTVSKSIADDVLGAIARRVAALKAASNFAKLDCLGVASEKVYVIGRQADTAVAKSWPGHEILDIPNWTPAKNDAWINQIIREKAPVYIGSPQTRATLWDAKNARETIFARELRQLRGAGYKEVGDYLIPPP